MSYILDALKKAEQERDIGRVPGIGSEHEPVMAHRPGRWVWVLLGVLLINALLLAFALWPRSAVTPHASAPLPAGPPEPALAEAVPADGSPAVPNEPAQSGAASSDGPGPVAVAPKLPPRTGLRPLPPISEAPQPEPAPGPAEVPSAPAAVAPEPLKVLPPAPAPAPPSAPAVSYNNLPVWPQISAQLLRELNSNLHVDVHVYSDVPHERFVLINMRKYKEGEKLQEGPVVDAITPDSVILSFRGQRFRMQAQ